MSDEQYFADSPSSDTQGSSRREVTVSVGSSTLHLLTDRGVFSRQNLDTGTRILLDAAALPPRSGHLLDLGCGWGPIAATMATYSPNATIWAVDINTRALELTRLNAQRNGLVNLRAVVPDDIPESVRFDAIWSNPPVRIGKAALRELLRTWLARLTDHGEAWLVINRNLGSDSLAVWLQQSGYHVDRLTSKQGFRVLRVRPVQTRGEST